ncbi:hypothetical protein GCM10022237_28850 [Nocardioides ginsengisoli]|uniref:Lipoprotein n=1 Tax=Nocardioides ginsengisoli TaxID=363868 RepID=A0ABW3W5U5_9ACTN
MRQLIHNRLAAVLVLTLCIFFGACDSKDGAGAGRGTGPVSFDSKDGGEQWAFVRAAKGQQVVFGALGVTNHGDEAATLTSAILTGPDDVVADEGARLATVLVRPVAAGADYVGAAVWPFKRYAEGAAPLEGYKLAPHATAELLYIVNVKEQGHWFWPRSEVRYTSGGKRYHDSTSTGFLVCPPGLDRSCDPPD